MAVHDKRLVRLATAMEMNSTVRAQPYIFAHQMGENQGRKFGVMGESPLFRPTDGRNDVIAHLFRPRVCAKATDERC